MKDDKVLHSLYISNILMKEAVTNLRYLNETGIKDVKLMGATRKALSAVIKGIKLTEKELE